MPETAATVWLLPNGNVMHVCGTFTDLFGYGEDGLADLPATSELLPSVSAMPPHPYLAAPALSPL